MKYSYLTNFFMLIASFVVSASACAEPSSLAYDASLPPNMIDPATCKTLDQLGRSDYEAYWTANCGCVPEGT